MKSDYLCILLVVLACLWDTGEGRGGRGRGGGSFGGLFGSFRKYKKLSSTGSGRRTVNGSPMQPVATKPLKPSATSHVKPPPYSAKPAPPPTYAQAMSGSSYHNYYGSPAGAAHIPPGGSYYGHGAAMPPGAIYYAQPPMQSSSGTGNFLFGMMAGHVMGSMMRGPHVHHVTNVYRQNESAANADGRKVIIIENGNATDAAAANLWPTDSVVPLAEFNATITPPDALETGNKTIFPKRANTPVDSQSSDATPIHHQSNLDASTAAQESSTVPPLPPGGIICVPVLLNVTDPSDSEQRVQQVEKVLCYPAPPPPPTVAAAVPNCADPSSLSADGSNADCLDSGDANQLSTIEPPQIAGEIQNDSAEQQRVN